MWETHRRLTPLGWVNVINSPEVNNSRVGVWEVAVYVWSGWNMGDNISLLPLEWICLSKPWANLAFFGVRWFGRSDSMGLSFFASILGDLDPHWGNGTYGSSNPADSAFALELVILFIDTYYLMRHWAMRLLYIPGRFSVYSNTFFI